MTRVQQRASLHEKTIQKVARDALTPPPKQKRVRSQQRVQPTHGAPLVHEQVWAEVEKILASGHGYTKWELINDTEMVVR